MRDAFTGVVLDTVVKYVPLNVVNHNIRAILGWVDGTTAATVILEFTDDAAAPLLTAGELWQWADSGVSITNPAGAGAGASLVTSSAAHARARLKITATADCDFAIWDGIRL